MNHPDVRKVPEGFSHESPIDILAYLTGDDTYVTPPEYAKLNLQKEITELEISDSPSPDEDESA